MSEDFEWGGPKQIEMVEGTVEAMESVPSEYGANRIKITLFPSKVYFTNGAVEEHTDEPYDIWSASEGKPGAVLFGSLKKCLKLEEKGKVVGSAVVGGKIKIAYSSESFIGKDKQQHDMPLRKVLEFVKTVVDVDRATVVEVIKGKTPAEVYALAANYSGTEWGRVLKSKPQTEKAFKGLLELVDGRYQVKS